ncbi:MAG: YfbM family protein [Candidatus Accumulibacter sp.]|jgi:hypothetical protein|nr:YfbM family protein [Accumulibacter sp.]
MSNPLCLYAITPEQLDALFAEPMKLVDIGEWVAADPRNYAEARCGLGLTGDSTLADLVPMDAPLCEEAMAELAIIAHYMAPERVREVARKYADFQIEGLTIDKALTELFSEETIKSDLPHLFEFYQAAAKGEKVVVGTFAI